MQTSLVIGLVFCAVAGPALAQVTLVSRGSFWQYYVSGLPATNWAQPGFDSRTWPGAEAQLGFGDDDEETQLFDDWGDAPATIYFRRGFTVTNLPALFSVTLRLLADDGAVVYLNGQEAARRNRRRVPSIFSRRRPPTWKPTRTVSPNSESFRHSFAPARTPWLWKCINIQPGGRIAALTWNCRRISRWSDPRRSSSVPPTAPC